MSTVAPDSGLKQRIAARSAVAPHPSVAAFAHRLAGEAGAVAVLFYGSNLRTGELEGVLDFYLLLPGAQREKIWPRVSYHEWQHDGNDLRAKVATMALETFGRAARGQSRDTTIWARFVQPSALIWAADDAARAAVLDAQAAAACTAARLAVALGPDKAPADEFWKALFRATYRAEFRVEKAGREASILEANADHFAGLLPLALEADGIPFTRDDCAIAPQMDDAERLRILRWWNARRRRGKPLNILRLLKASTTFEGAGRYAAWKVERHTGIPVKITPWRERHPVLAAPGVLWAIWREKRRRGER